MENKDPSLRTNPLLWEHVISTGDIKTVHSCLIGPSWPASVNCNCGAKLQRWPSSSNNSRSSSSSSSISSSGQQLWVMGSGNIKNVELDTITISILFPPDSILLRTGQRCEFLSSLLMTGMRGHSHAPHLLPMPSILLRSRPRYPHHAYAAAAAAGPPDPPLTHSTAVLLNFSLMCI